MRITGRQLRQIIKEEVARMVNEEGPTTFGEPVSIKVDNTRAQSAMGAEPAFKGDPGSARIMSKIQRAGRDGLVKAPRVDRSKYGAAMKRVLDKLISGQFFSDRNFDADAAMVVNALASALSAANPDNASLARAVEGQLPTSPFSPLLAKIQRMLGIRPDGVLGLQTYFAMLTGGAINFNDDKEAVTVGRRQLEALFGVIGSGSTASSGVMTKAQIDALGEEFLKMLGTQPATRSTPPI